MTTPHLDRLLALAAGDDGLEEAAGKLMRECPWYRNVADEKNCAHDPAEHCDRTGPPGLVVKFTPHTAEASTVDKPTRPPGGPGLFRIKGRHLPPYIQHLWFHLVKEYGEQKAYGVAVGIVKKWAAGTAPGGKKGGKPRRTHPDVQAAAAKNVAEWEKDKSDAHAQDREHVRATVALAATETKEQAGYEPGGGTPGHRCGDCTMFRDGSCTLVEGAITPGSVCREFDPEKKAARLTAPGAGATPFPGDVKLPLPATPRDTRAMFTAHRVNDIRTELAHAAERMGAARKAKTADARRYEMVHVHNHLIDSVNQVHQLAANYRDNYPAEGAEMDAMKAVLGLSGKSVSPRAKAATTAHLTQTIANELTHAKRHADVMLRGEGDDEWNFNFDHCHKHLRGAVEHAAKLSGHLCDNYPAEGRWLRRLQLEPGREHAASPGLRKSVHLAGGAVGGGAVVTAPGAMPDRIPPATGGKYSQYGLHQKPSQTVSPSPPLPPSVPVPTPDEVRKLIPGVPECADVSLRNTVLKFLETAAVKLEKDDELQALVMLRAAGAAILAAHKADLGVVLPAFYTAGVFSRIPPAEQSSAGQTVLEGIKRRDAWRRLEFEVQVLADRIRKRFFRGHYNGPSQMNRM